MSSKGLHVQDNSVAERRLRPIYDWLDSGNNKKALQECNKVLSKTPNLHCAKALKALTLHRLGKEADCVAILDGLVDEKPTDDATLQAISLCYREMQQLHKICKLYETALSLDPTNEELHTHLFMSYVRVSDFKSQQQAAMTLYKLKPKNPYYCWAVMSIILQVTRGEGSTDPKKRALLLSLAERMMDKLISDNKLEAEQEVQLYTMILELQGKYDGILALLDGPLGAKLVCNNLPQTKLNYCIKMKRWKDVNMLCKQILGEFIDRWDIWKEYVNSVFELTTSTDNGTIEPLGNHENHENGDTVDDTPEKAHEFICRLIENVIECGQFLRGPYLARFELCAKLAKHNMSTDLIGDTLELFIEYFRKFGHKPCCVSDLRIYLSLLSSEKRCELASKIVKDVGISATSVPQSELQMQKHICALQLSRLCGSHRNLSVEHLKALVTALSLHYQHGYQTYGTKLLSTDMGPSDPYALLAAHVLYDLAQLEPNSDQLIVALVLLDSLLKNSPSNFHAKLLSIKLHHMLGNGLGAQELYNSLDVKHLQLDSLGFMHCARLPTTGLFLTSNFLCDTTLRFFLSNYKDSSDHLTFSYKFGSFLKLDEFMDFRERLNNSLHYTTVAIDRIIFSLIECLYLDNLYTLDVSPKDDKIEWDSLRDNHDLSVFVSWDPERIDGPPEECADVKTLFEQDVCYLKLRTSALWALSAAISVVKSTDGTRGKYVESLESSLGDWEVLYKNVTAKEHIPIGQSQVILPLPSRLHAALVCPNYEILHGIFEVFLILSKNNTDNFKLDVKNALSKMSTFVEENTLKVSSEFQQRRHSMEIVVNCVEILSISSLVCLLCNELVKPVQGKRNKKKASDLKSRECLNQVIVELKTQINSLCDLVQNWVSTFTINDMQCILESLNLNTDGNSVYQGIINSYQTASKEIQNVLKAKLKMLNGIS